MKKHIYLFVALATLLLASCKNEDIDISREVSFEVNPYEVINDFVNNEVNQGDLEDIASGYRVRVNLFVYDAYGYLKDSEVEYLSGYRETMNANFDLPDGNYTVVATTDIVKYNGSVSLEFWNFSGMEKLTTLKIKDAGYLGLTSKILGIGHKNITVKSGQTVCHVPMKPAGSLVISQIWDINHFNFVEVYNLLSNRGSESFSFNNDGSYNSSYEEVPFYTWYVYRFHPSNYTSYGGYGYQFLAYQGETHFMWEAEAGGESIELSDDMSLNIKEGKTYQFTIDLDQMVYYYGEVEGSKAIVHSPNGKTITRSSNQDAMESSKK